jgi:hypothetical protein
MINKLAHSLENTMKINRTLSWLAGAVLACGLLAAPSAKAQTTSAKAVTVNSTSATGLHVTGTATYTATYVPDLSNPAGTTDTVEVDLDGTKLTATDAAGNAYTLPTCISRLTRLVVSKDTVSVTCAAIRSDGTVGTVVANGTLTFSSTHTITGATVTISTL